MIPVAELQAFYRAIETREVALIADSEPQMVEGNVLYRATNGWTITIFNDANEYDYVDSVTTADGREVDFDELEETRQDWYLDDDLAWKCLGIPGYCIHRCTACGAVLPKVSERRTPWNPPPFLCGDDTCVGAGQPVNGTWIQLRVQ